MPSRNGSGDGSPTRTGCTASKTSKPTEAVECCAQCIVRQEAQVVGERSQASAYLLSLGSHLSPRSKIAAHINTVDSIVSSGTDIDNMEGINTYSITFHLYSSIFITSHTRLIARAQ